VLRSEALRVDLRNAGVVSTLIIAVSAAAALDSSRGARNDGMLSFFGSGGGRPRPFFLSGSKRIALWQSLVALAMLRLARDDR
jgi:hypothetical protein